MIVRAASLSLASVALLTLLADRPAAGQGIRLSSPLQAGDVEEMVFSPDGRYALFVATEVQNDELFAATLDAPITMYRLSHDFGTWDDVASFAVSPDSTRAVYRVFFDGGLFSVPLDGSASPVRISGPVGPSHVTDFAISADSAWVVFRGDLLNDDQNEIFSVPLDGSLPPQRLNEPFPHPLVFVEPEFQISPDSTRVVYETQEEPAFVHELFSVPIDASAAPVKLNGAPAGSGVVDFTISPDSSRVVYRADQESFEEFEIFSVPLGGGSAVQLNGPLVQWGGVAEFEVAPDSSRVVYLANEDALDDYELFSVPLDASAAPVRLNGTLVAGGSVAPLSTRVAADASRVIYVADQDTDGVDELYSAPLDGSAAPVKLHAPLPPGMSAGLPAISDDAAQVVFLSNLDQGTAFELFRAPIDGSAAPVRLSGTLVAGGDVQDFAIDAQSRRVVYLADQDVQWRTELYSAALDGSEPIRRLNAELRPDGQVHAFALAPNAKRVLYLADQDSVNIELFLSQFTPLHARKKLP